MASGAPLRSAIHWLAGADTTWTCREAADLAGLAEDAARGYLRILVAQEVLVQTEPDHYRAGPQCAAWRATPQKSHAGGNAAEYQRKKRIRDAVRQREWRERMALRGSQSAKLWREKARNLTPQNSANDEKNIDITGEFEKKMIGYYTFAALLDCSRRKLEYLVAAGKVRHVRVGKVVRFPPSVVAEALEQGIG